MLILTGRGKAVIRELLALADHEEPAENWGERALALVAEAGHGRAAEVARPLLPLAIKLLGALQGESSAGVTGDANKH